MPTHPRCLLLALGLLVAADRPKPPAPTDRDKIQGSWQVVAGESRGKPAPEDALKGLKLVVHGEKITGEGTGKGFVLSYQLDPTRKPRAIDLTNPERRETLLGIYDLKGDTWTLCLGAPGEGRPRSFATKDNPRAVRFTLKREK